MASATDGVAGRQRAIGEKVIQWRLALDSACRAGFSQLSRANQAFMPTEVGTTDYTSRGETSGSIVAGFVRIRGGHREDIRILTNPATLNRTTHLMVGHRRPSRIQKRSVASAFRRTSETPQQLRS